MEEDEEKACESASEKNEKGHGSAYHRSDPTLVNISMVELEAQQRITLRGSTCVTIWKFVNLKIQF